MSAVTRGSSRRNAAQLAMEFDQSFTRRPVRDDAEIEELMAVRVGSDAYALRISEIAGLALDRPIVALPNSTGTFLGLAGIRGRIVTVYGLRGLLGGASAPRVTPRWLAVLPESVALALAFDELDGQLRIPRSDLLSACELQSPRQHIRAAARADGILRSVVDIGSLVDEIRSRAGQIRA